MIRRTASIALLPVLMGSAAAALAAPVGVAVVGAGGAAVAGAVVFLESPAAAASARALQGVEIEQAERRFTQRVTVVTPGTAVSFPNRDKVRHHVYSFSPTKAFELKLYAGTPANPVVFDRPGVAVLGCNIHDTMAAWVLVVATPHFGHSGADGRVRLADVPPGSYRLRVWHAELPLGTPALDQALQVPAQGAQVQVQLTLPG